MNNSFWQQMLSRHERNLEKLLAQQSVYAEGEVPLRLLNQIESERVEIHKARQRLGLPEEPESLLELVPGPKAEKQVRATALFRLQLLPDGLNRISVRGLETPGGGQPRANGALPFDSGTLQAVLAALDRGTANLVGLSPSMIDALQVVSLAQDKQLISNFLQSIGQKLYQTLFQQEILTEFIFAQRQYGAVELQLNFDPEDVFLSQYPWELIHDGISHLLLTRDKVQLTRTIAFAEPPPELSFGRPLKVLTIHPRPQDQSYLPDAERTVIRRELGKLAEKATILWNEPFSPTWAALEEILNDSSPDILHFDGHGMFALHCPSCGTYHAPNVQICSHCRISLEGVHPQGYLLFETQEHLTDAINIVDLKLLLRNSGLRLCVLTACGSAQIAGVSAWNGIAPGLLQTGIPAVIGMQGSPEDTAMVRFVERFYQMLAQGETIPEAVNRGRLAIYRHTPPCWYMPVVYLRSAHQAQGTIF